MTEYMDLRPRVTLEEPSKIDPDLSPVDYLLTRTRDLQTEKLNARDRIAIALLPFFAPKLQATAHLDGKDFGSILDRRIAHWKKLKSQPRIEAKPVVVGEPYPYLPTVPDMRRFRRRI